MRVKMKWGIEKEWGSLVRMGMEWGWVELEMGWRDGDIEAGHKKEGWNWDKHGNKDGKEVEDRMKTSEEMEMGWGGREGNGMGLWVESDRRMEMGLGVRDDLGCD